jgi:hypothetical protein
MNVRTIVLTTAAFAVLGVLGYLAGVSPEFKYHATTVAIVVLGLISLAGVLAALITPLLPGPDELEGQKHPQSPVTAATGLHQGDEL